MSYSGEYKRGTVKKKMLENYCEGNLNEEEQILVEDEILAEDNNLEEFISIIQDSINDEDCGLTLDFTDKIIDIIDKEDKLENISRQQKIKNNKTNLLIYYAAVASITIIFSLTGVFDRVCNHIGDKAYAVEEKQNYIMVIEKGWTDKLASHTSNLINSMVFGKEVSYEKEK